jgi:hypothetical protein
MLKFYLNRELSLRLGIPLSRWKRWSREFLPPDPLGGHQSGYARQYSLKDAFYVYLAGYLVSAMGFSIPEARQILLDLNGWLKKNIIEHLDVAGGLDQPVASGGMRTDLLIMPAKRRKAPAFTYRIRSLVDRKQYPDGDATLWQERYTEQVIKPGELLNSGCYPACARWVDLSALVGHFFLQMTSKEI